MGPLCTIDSLLQACESTCAAHLSKARRAELRACEHYLKNSLGLLYHHKKIFGVEVDLIFYDQAGNIIFVEVKTQNSFSEHVARLSQKQSERLLRAKLFFESTFGVPVEVRLALVTASGLVEDRVIL